MPSVYALFQQRNAPVPGSLESVQDKGKRGVEAPLLDCNRFQLPEQRLRDLNRIASSDLSTALGLNLSQITKRGITPPSVHPSLLEQMPLDRKRHLFESIGLELRQQDKAAFVRATNHIIDDRNSELESMLCDIEALSKDEDYTEDCLKPTPSAIEEVRSLLEGASRYVNGYFPYGTVYPDGDGGLRTEWIETGCELRLVVSSEPTGRKYIYHEKGEEFKNEYDVTAQNLGCWLNWLNTNGQSR